MVIVVNILIRSFALFSHFQVPLSVESLNQGDCFVLDCGRKIYVWNGKSSNKSERFNVRF